jgi:hypothetical protein
MILASLILAASLEGPPAPEVCAEAAAAQQKIIASLGVCSALREQGMAMCQVTLDEALYLAQVSAINAECAGLDPAHAGTLDDI